MLVRPCTAPLAQVNTYPATVLSLLHLAAAGATRGDGPRGRPPPSLPRRPCILARASKRSPPGRCGGGSRWNGPAADAGVASRRALRSVAHPPIRVQGRPGRARTRRRHRLRAVMPHRARPTRRSGRGNGAPLDCRRAPSSVAPVEMEDAHARPERLGLQDLGEEAWAVPSTPRSLEALLSRVVGGAAPASSLPSLSVRGREDLLRPCGLRCLSALSLGALAGCGGTVRRTVTAAAEKDRRAATMPDECHCRVVGTLVVMPRAGLGLPLVGDPGHHLWCRLSPGGGRPGLTAHVGIDPYRRRRSAVCLDEEGERLWRRFERASPPMAEVVVGDGTGSGGGVRGHLGLAPGGRCVAGACGRAHRPHPLAIRGFVKRG